VIGLKNLDAQSQQFRPFKQMIERLNRTYKYHVQSQNGFASAQGAIAKLVLFVTHYNFLRPHSSLDYRTPIELPELASILTIQGKWAKIISMACE
jgi:transposase InsO family protein